MSDCAGYSVHYKLSLKIKRNQKAFNGNSFLEELVNIGSNFGGLSYQRKSSENHSWPTIEKFVFMKILNLINNLKIWKQLLFTVTANQQSFPTWSTSKQMVSLKIKFIRIHITYLESNFLYDIVDM